MAGAFTFTLANNSALERLKKGGKIVDSAAKAVLNKSGLMILSVAKPEAPADKGTLRNSLTKSDAKKSGNNYQIEVGSNVKYAPFQELGTGIYGHKRSPIRPKRAKFLYFKTKSGQEVFARSVKGVKPKKFLEKGFKALQNNTEMAFTEADRIMQQL